MACALGGPCSVSLPCVPGDEGHGEHSPDGNQGRRLKRSAGPSRCLLPEMLLSRPLSPRPRVHLCERALADLLPAAAAPVGHCTEPLVSRLAHPVVPCEPPNRVFAR